MLTAALVDARELYLANRELIDRTATSIARRNHVSHADAEDFRSLTHVHLIDDDYAVLRAYEGRAEVGAFLHAVIRRLFQDWRNANWGRWRPSAEARRQGPIAMQLETLLVRDRRPLHEAVEVLRTNHGVVLTVAELDVMAAAFPPRTMRSFTTADVLDDAADQSASEFSSASSLVDDEDAAAGARRVSAALSLAMSELPPQDQLILRMRFENGAAISVISRVLGLEQQPLYRRVERLLTSVRSRLEEAGVGADEARDVMHRRGFELLEGGRS